MDVHNEKNGYVKEVMKATFTTSHVATPSSTAQYRSQFTQYIVTAHLMLCTQTADYLPVLFALISMFATAI